MKYFPLFLWILLLLNNIHAEVTGCMKNQDSGTCKPEDGCVWVNQGEYPEETDFEDVVDLAGKKKKASDGFCTETLNKALENYIKSVDGKGPKLFGGKHNLETIFADIYNALHTDGIDFYLQCIIVFNIMISVACGVYGYTLAGEEARILQEVAKLRKELKKERIISMKNSRLAALFEPASDETVYEEKQEPSKKKKKKEKSKKDKKKPKSKSEADLDGDMDLNMNAMDDGNFDMGAPMDAGIEAMNSAAAAEDGEEKPPELEFDNFDELF